MEAISNQTPTAPAGNKPIMPWVISAASAIFIVVLLGVGAYQLYRFQKPYSLDSTSERTIEITEAKRVIDSPEKPATRNQVGLTDVQNRNNNVSQEPNTQLVDRAQMDGTRDTNKDNIIQKSSVSISGSVVDTDGNAVPGLELRIKPLKINENRSMITLTPMSSWERVVTDKQGGFSFVNIDPISSQLVMLPEAGSEYEIISLTIGEFTFYTQGHQRNLPFNFGKLTFAIEPGVSLEDLVVTVKPPSMRIRGRILLKDGTPLANAGFRLTVRSRNKDTFLFIFNKGESRSSSSRGAKTDSQGYFVSYKPNETADYVVSVKYEGETVNSRWFRLKEGQRYDKLVFKLKLTDKHRNNLRERIDVRQAIWSVNPENGHAYKRIQCDSWNDAQIKAASENAYLVAINDESEQRWLEGRFAENKFFWIGLSLEQDGGTWQWENGEPLTYTNWLTTVGSNLVSNIPVALEFSSKRWMVIGPDSQFLSSIKHAIIEKEVRR